MSEGAASIAAAPVTLEDIEVGLLLEGVYRQYGYDFRDYAISSVRRRVRHLMREEGLATISGLQEKVLHDPRALQRFVVTLSVNVTSMFRDPAFYKALRERVVPLLRTYPKVRICTPDARRGKRRTPSPSCWRRRDSTTAARSTRRT